MSIPTCPLTQAFDYYGARGAANWFCSLLNSRKQCVKLNGCNSSVKLVPAGAPQESVLGSLFFLVYVNDLHKRIKYSKAYHLANDTNMHQSDSSLTKPSQTYELSS